MRKRRHSTGYVSSGSDYGSEDEEPEKSLEGFVVPDDVIIYDSLTDDSDGSLSDRVGTTRQKRKIRREKTKTKKSKKKKTDRKKRKKSRTPDSTPSPSDLSNSLSDSESDLDISVKRKKHKIIPNITIDSDSDNDLSNNEENNEVSNNEEDDEIQIICEVPGERSTIVRTSYRVRVTSSPSSATETSDDEDLNLGIEYNKEDFDNIDISDISLSNDIFQTEDDINNSNELQVNSLIDSLPTTPQISLQTSLPANPNDSSHPSSDILNDNDMDISDGEILSGDEILDSYDMPTTPLIPVDPIVTPDYHSINSPQHEESVDKDEANDKRSDDTNNDIVLAPKSSSQTQVSQTTVAQTSSNIEPNLQDIASPESPEPIASPSPPPLPETPGYPEPQLPTNSIPGYLVKTPTARNMFPHETKIIKQGKEVKIPAPPMLPETLFLNVKFAPDIIKEIQRILNNDNDEVEAINETLEVSIKCPISGKRVSKPFRSIYCNHFDCFNIDDFLELNYNKKVEDWKCPKCKQPAHKDYLFHDCLIDHIIKHPFVDSNVESVIFDNNAIWRPKVNTSEQAGVRPEGQNTISIDETAADIIELDDDDDDEPPPPVSTSAPSMPTAQRLLNNVQPSASIQSSTSLFNNVNPNDPRLRSRTLAQPSTDRSPVPRLVIRTSNGTPIVVDSNRQTQQTTAIRNPVPTNVVNPVVANNNSNQGARPNGVTNHQIVANYARLPNQVVRALGTYNNNAVFEFNTQGVMRRVYCNLCQQPLNVQDLSQIWTHFNNHLNSTQSSNGTQVTNGHNNTVQQNGTTNRTQNTNQHITDIENFVNSISTRINTQNVVNQTRNAVQSAVNQNRNTTNVANGLPSSTNQSRSTSSAQTPQNPLARGGSTTVRSTYNRNVNFNTYNQTTINYNQMNGYGHQNPSNQNVRYQPYTAHAQSIQAGIQALRAEYTQLPYTNQQPVDPNFYNQQMMANPRMFNAVPPPQFAAIPPPNQPYYYDPNYTNFQQ